MPYAFVLSKNQNVRFQKPTRTWLLVVYVFMPRPLLSLYGIIYVTRYTRTYRLTVVAFSMPVM